MRTLVHHGELYTSAWLLPGFEVGLGVVRALSEDRLPPSALRLSDESETERLLAAAHIPGLVRGGLAWLAKRRPRVLLLVIADGPPGHRALMGRRVRAAALGAGGVPLGSGPARQWMAPRFSQPELRDALLDTGIGAGA